MGQALDSIPNHTKALAQLKQCIKDGRENIAKGKWQTLMKIVNDIQDILEYLHVYGDVLPADKLFYNNKNTDNILKLFNVIRQQIMYEYWTKNIYNYNLIIGGDTIKKRELSFSWKELEIEFNLLKSYLHEEHEEYGSLREIYDEKGNEEMPEYLRE